jgi:hypothetical protein
LSLPFRLSNHSYFKCTFSINDPFCKQCRGITISVWRYRKTDRLLGALYRPSCDLRLTTRTRSALYCEAPGSCPGYWNKTLRFPSSFVNVMPLLWLFIKLRKE